MAADKIPVVLLIVLMLPLSWSLENASNVTSILTEEPTSISTPITTNSCPSENDLRQALLSKQGYTPSVRPLFDATRPIEVTLGLSIMRLNDIIEKEQTLSLTAFILVEWTNEFLVWKNDSQFNCINDLIFAGGEIWLPDVSLTNTGDIYDLLLSNGHKILARSDGRNFYRPAKKIDVFCELDLTYFPFDTQKCFLNFESWLYTTNYQTFKVTDPPVHLMRWTENDQWVLKTTYGKLERVTYEVENEWFDRATFALILQRRVAYYTINVIAPSIIIAFVELVIFMLPTVEIEKVPISFSCLLAYSVFQLMINDDMPRTSEHTPMLSYYIIFQMFYLSIAIMGQGVVFLFIWNLEQIKPVPQKLYRVLRAIGRLACMRESDDMEDAEIDQSLMTACGNLDHRHPSIHHLGNGDANDGSGNNSSSTALQSYVRRLTQIVEREEDIMSRHRRLSSNNVIPIIETIVNDADIRLSAVREESQEQEEEDGHQNGEVVKEEQVIVEETRIDEQFSSSGGHETLRKTTSNRSSKHSGGRKKSSIGDHVALAREMLERIETSRHHSVIKAQWLFMANVVDRYILVIYTMGIVITPVVIFGILPLI